MKRFRFILFGQVKEFYAPKNDFVRKFRKSYPQFGYMKLTDFKDLKIVE